jgi:hypothetical protein
MDLGGQLHASATLPLVPWTEEGWVGTKFGLDAVVKKKSHPSGKWNPEFLVIRSVA